MIELCEVPCQVPGIAHAAGHIGAETMGPVLLLSGLANTDDE